MSDSAAEPNTGPERRSRPQVVGRGRVATIASPLTAMGFE